MLAPWEGDRIHEIGVDDLELTLGSVKGQACLNHVQGERKRSLPALGLFSQPFGADDGSLPEDFFDSLEPLAGLGRTKILTARDTSAYTLNVQLYRL